MRLHQRASNHLRWRGQRARHFYRDLLFEFAGRHRSFVRARDQHGNVYLVSTGDSMIGRGIFISGQFEAHKIQTVLDVLDAEAVPITHILDIGANIGTTTIEMLTRRPGLTADCFEPEPLNHRLLERNIAGSAIRGRARTHQIALSNIDGNLRFELAVNQAGDHRVRTSDAPGAFGEATREVISVPARRLDGLDLAVDASTLACIDVQGHEWNVLAGATNLVGPIALEFWPYGLARAGTLEALIGLLQGMRRPMFDITGSVARMDAGALAGFAAEREPDFARELLVLPARRSDDP